MLRLYIRVQMGRPVRPGKHTARAVALKRLPVVKKSPDGDVSGQVLVC